MVLTQLTNEEFKSFSHKFPIKSLYQTKEYADSLLANTEDVLNETLNKLGTNMTEALNLMQISLEDTIKTIQNSRKELK